jgi:hypothetical protein
MQIAGMRIADVTPDDPPDDPAPGSDDDEPRDERGGFSHSGEGGAGPKGGGYVQPNEQERKRQIKARIERLKARRRAREAAAQATARKKKDDVLDGTFKQFVSL